MSIVPRLPSATIIPFPIPSPRVRRETMFWSEMDEGYYYAVFAGGEELMETREGPFPNMNAAIEHHLEEREAS